MVKLFFILMFLGLCVEAHSATYYIDFASGSDTSNGLSKATPWQRHPYTKGWAGTYSHQAGDRFIFKGGSRWTSGSFVMTIVNGGVTGNSDYYGVDTTWFTGVSFVSPIFDGEGAAIDGLVNILNPSNITFDNIEMRDVIFTSNEGGGLVAIGNLPKNILIKNCYLHKWTLSATITTDDAHGGVIVNTANVPPVGIVVDSTTISNAEYSSTRNNGVAIRAVQTLSNSLIHDVPTAVLYAGDVHGNQIYNINYPTADFDPLYHTNLIYMAAQSFNPPTEFIYNNKIHDVGTGAGIYAEPCFYASFGAATVFIYNNLVYNSYMSGGGIVLVDPEGGSGSCGSVSIFQNTLQESDTAQIGMIRSLSNHSGTNNIASIVTQNNHYIGPNDEWDLTLAASFSSSHNVQQTNAQATTAGYKLSNLFQPTLTTSLTVDQGIPVTCANCPLWNKDILGVSRGQGANWDVGAYEFNSGTSSTLHAPTNLRIVSSH